jgi:hypothetical protein
MLSATGAAVLPAWLIRTVRIGRTGDAPRIHAGTSSAPKENAMDSHAMFLNCPAYMDKDGGTRCGPPAEVEYRYTMNSTDGPLESAKISCRAGTTSTRPLNTSLCQSSRPPPPDPPARRQLRPFKAHHRTPDGRRKTITPPIRANYPLALLFLSAWAGIQLQMTSPPHTPTCPPRWHSPPTASRKPARPPPEQRRRTGEEPPSARRATGRSAR